MKDPEALDFLQARLGTDADVARALGVRPQVLWNWRDRHTISAEKRPAVWAMVNDHGGNLPRDWLFPKKDAA